MKDHPEVLLRTLSPGQESDFWKALEVKGTPTILMEDTHTGHSAILRGFAVEAKLTDALAEVMTREK